jgi:O-antigen/teichoic acid export membrane protein
LNPFKQLAGQTIIYGFSSIVPKFLNYILVPFHTILIFKQPAEYGIITELYAYVTFLNILLTYGMETGLFRFSQSEKDREKVFTTSFCSVLFTSLLFIVLSITYSDAIASWLDYGSHKEYILMFIFILGLDAISAIPFAGLRQKSRPVKFAAIKIGSVVVNIFFNFFFLWFCPRFSDHVWIKWFFDPSAGVYYVFLSNLIASAATLIFLIPEIFSYHFRFSRALLQRMLIYSLPLMFAGFAGNVNEAIDRVLLKKLLPDSVDAMAQLGIYGANIKIAVLMVLFIQMFRYAAEPFFFGQSGKENSRAVIAGVMKYFVLFCLVIFLGVNFFIDYIKFFVGEKYWDGLGVVPILLMANLALGVYYNLSIWFKLNNMTYYGVMIALVGATVSFLLNFLLIPEYGYLASAWTHLVSYLCMIVLTWYLGNKYYPVPYEVKTIFLYTALALGLYFLSRWMSIDGLLLKTLVHCILFFIFILIVLSKEGWFKKKSEIFKL